MRIVAIVRLLELTNDRVFKQLVSRFLHGQVDDACALRGPKRFTRQLNRTCRLFLDTAQASCKRGLPCAVGTDKADDCPRGDIKIAIIYHCIPVPIRDT